jgi:chromosomal replication initiator protein
MTPPSLWTGVLERLAAEIGPFALRVWLHPLAAAAEGDALRLDCPSEFHRDRIRERLLAPIARCAEAEAGRPVQVSLGVRDAAGEAAFASAQPAAIPAAPRAAAPPATAPVPAQASLPYCFDSFVVGPGNALAREACVALAGGHQPGLSLLYLASEPGLGKTHLARATVAAACASGGARAIYVSAEGFTSEFQSAVRAGRMEGFKRRYRNGCDLLVVEDVQFLPGKRATQLELFHTLEHLRDAGARMVFTGDRLPARIPDLEPRLASRWTSGLVVEIEAPDAQVRRRILAAKAAAGGVHLPEDCLDLLVESLRGSVRDLEGALIQLVATASLLKRSIDHELTEAALRKVLPLAGALRRLEPEDVIEVVATFFRTTPAALASRSRRRDVLVPRQLAMYLCRRYTEAPLARIGQALGRDHPAVRHAVALVERQILERAPLRYQVESLCARIEERAGRGKA